MLAYQRRRSPETLYQPTPGTPVPFWVRQLTGRTTAEQLVAAYGEGVRFAPPRRLNSVTYDDLGRCVRPSGPAALPPPPPSAQLALW